MEELLPYCWAVIILFAIMMYVVMDGFDLGIGLLYPFFPDRLDRDRIMNSVAPVWDGNETWLILGGVGLLAAFPLAYSIILSACYLPLILMLMGLIFRGVAFEFRFKAHEHERHLWDKAFIGGSLAATFFQGVTLGAYVQGFAVRERDFAGGPLDWLTPFSLFTGCSLLIGYALLGSTWLIMKTDGPLQQHAARIAHGLLWLLLAAILGVSLWTPLLDPAIAQRWFGDGHLLWLSPMPLLVMLCAWLLRQALYRGREIAPFLYTLALIFLCYAGLGISLWPNAVPPGISLQDASSPPQSQLFTLVGTLIILPVILGYTAWSYRVFRGKVGHAEHYH
jgi:cytochrome d ubiquinol oxidase subunit II